MAERFGAQGQSSKFGGAPLWYSAERRTSTTATTTTATTPTSLVGKLKKDLWGNWVLHRRHIFAKQSSAKLLSQTRKLARTPNPVY